VVWAELSVSMVMSLKHPESSVHEHKGIMTVYCGPNLCHRRATAGVIVF